MEKNKYIVYMKKKGGLYRNSKKYESLKEAALENNVDVRNIFRSCKIGYATKGLHLKYYE